MKVARAAATLVFRLLVGAFGVFLIALAVFPIRAQTATQVELSDLERRITGVESLQLDHRLTSIEALLSSEDTWHRFSMGGIGALISERVARAIQKQRAQKEDEA